MSDPVLVNGLHLQNASARPVSLGVLNAFPSGGPDHAGVASTARGSPARWSGPDYPIGSLVKTVDSRGEQLYVVLRERTCNPSRRPPPTSSGTANADDASDVSRYRPCRAR